MNPWSINGLADEAGQLFPSLASLARTVAGPAPRMFSGGAVDLPAFTASGVDPSLLLLRVPYRARHHAAAVTTPDEVLADFRTTYGENPTAHVDHEGLREAVARIRVWLQRAVDAHTATKRS